MFQIDSPPNLLLNILPSTAETKISYVIPGTKPRVVRLSIKPTGSLAFMIGGMRRKGPDLTIHVELGGLTGVVAPIIGKEPPDYHIWLQSGTPPAFVREEGPVHAKLAVKDEYTFAFLDLEDAHSERELERALTERVGAFLQEMGNMFAFVGSQYKIQVGEREFFIDLLLYHRQLRALVALELKIGEFEPEYIGKMQFYLSVLDDTVRLPEEQPSIGIFLCKSKDRLIAEYALKDATLPIGIA
jgi:hypothetical protein